MYLSLTFFEKDKKYGVITDENFTRFPGIFNTYAYQTTTSILNNNQSKFIKGTDLKKECCTTLSFLTKNLRSAFLNIHLSPLLMPYQICIFNKFFIKVCKHE